MSDISVYYVGSSPLTCRFRLLIALRETSPVLVIFSVLCFVYEFGTGAGDVHVHLFFLPVTLAEASTALHSTSWASIVFHGSSRAFIRCLHTRSCAFMRFLGTPMQDIYLLQVHTITVHQNSS